VSKVLCQELGVDLESCKSLWQKIMQQLRPWYDQESQRRRVAGIGGPTFDEVLAKAREIYQAIKDRPDDRKRSRS
jgi:hypothetical protein